MKVMPDTKGWTVLGGTPEVFATKAEAERWVTRELDRQQALQDASGVNLARLKAPVDDDETPSAADRLATPKSAPRLRRRIAQNPT